MLFNSFEFALFLPVVIAVAALVPSQWRWLWLLAASLVFYGWDDPDNLWFLGGVAAWAYLFGLAIRPGDTGRWRTGILAASLAGLLGSLVLFKFYDATRAVLSEPLQATLPALGITAPPGYSFYTFAAAAYLIDVYRRDLPAERHAGQFGLFVAWFPKVLVGPIARAKPFLAQTKQGLRANPSLAIGALQLFFWGLFKKVVVADNLAPVVDSAFAISPYAAPLELLIAVYFFAFQIYCDFSGMADMAIGASRLFGMELPINFRRPYLSRSVSEFWSQRWHITLGHWFRDYLYFPLGGSRAGRLRTYLNVMVVFLVSGLWHAGLGYGLGWSFLVWGLLNGLYQWGEMAATAPAGKTTSAGTENAWWVSLLKVILTFHLILVSWVFFRAESVGDALLVLQRIAAGIPDLPSVVRHYPFTGQQMLGAILIAILMSAEILDERQPLATRIMAWPGALRWSLYYLVLGTILVVGSWQGSRFIYMQF
jgi:alginate O-acetyltransferase complex protein AlgI